MTTSKKDLKIETVKNLKEKIAKAKAYFLTDYRGLTHPQLEQLRRALKKVHSEYIIAKNTLLKIALEGASDKIITELKNPTAAFFAFNDEIAAIKAIADFIKITQLPKIKIGLFSGNVATDSDFHKIASLPSREVLLAVLVSRLQSPISGLHNALSWNLKKLVTVLNNVNNKKV